MACMLEWESESLEVTSRFKPVSDLWLAAASASDAPAVRHIGEIKRNCEKLCCRGRQRMRERGHRRTKKDNRE